MGYPLTPMRVHVVFAVVLGLTAFASGLSDPAQLYSRLFGGEEQKGRNLQEFARFQKKYLMVMVLCLAGDWLQGPYMYALYDAYGFKHEEIAALFVAGFGSSCVFGTFVGSLADSLGRKRGALVYCVTYILSCLTKHWNSYRVLMVGRVLGGISTSLLFSVFDSWVVSEHARRGFDPTLLSTLFSNVQFANSIVAIFAGIVGEWSARVYELRPLFFFETKTIADDGRVMVGGYCTPFDAAAVVLCIGFVVIACSWTENYGKKTIAQKKQTQQQDSVFSSLKAGTLIVFRDKKILCVGAISACFEAAMYSFVFEWTPAVKVDEEDDPPYGEIFALMMLACMAGTRLYSSYLSASKFQKVTSYIFAASALALAVPALFEKNPLLCLLAFLVFEVAVGVYFPALGVLKSKLVPDTHRSTIYNLFRVPLNLLVLAVLLSRAPGKIIFAASAALLACAALLHFDLQRRLSKPELNDHTQDETPLLGEAGDVVVDHDNNTVIVAV